MLSLNQSFEHDTVPVHVVAEDPVEHKTHFFNKIHKPKHQDVSALVKEHRQLIEKITTQFADAVNAQLNGTISENDAEKDILLSFCEKFSAARDKAALYRLVSLDICELFSAKGFIIALLSNDEKSYTTFLSDLPEMAGNEAAIEEIMFGQFTFDVYFFNSIIRSSEPVIFSSAKICEDDKIARDLDIRMPGRTATLVGSALRAGEKNLGCLILFVDDGLYDDAKENLLKGISVQLSLAVSHTLSIEEINKREHERNLLLSLNTDIATVRNSKELELIIKQKLKNLLACSHTLIATLNDDLLSVSAFMLDLEAKAKDHPDYQNAKNGKYPIHDGLLDKAADTASPILFDLGSFKDKQEMPLHAQINFESGLKKLVIIRFSKGSDVFGFWMLYFESGQIIDQQKLSLIQSLSNQISIAVANILANQEIKDREQEKTRLLKFSNAIASVRDRTVLSRILTQQLHELFGIQSYVIHLLNDDSIKQMPLFFDPEGIYGLNPNFSKLIDSWTGVNDDVFNIILEADGPVSFELGDCLAYPDLLRYVNVLKGASDNSIIGIPIRLGSENIAVMNFTHDNYDKIRKQEYLLKSICSQIAIAISNIIANEKVNRQLSEINIYKQRLEEETVYLKEEIEINQNYAEIIGESLSMQKTFRLVTQVAPSDSTVLILGETGTGKELIARAIHNNSTRKNKLMVKVNCAALPANLIESELFGHERGSFTGATERRLGKFELANNGTLFLDEIGEMPLELQVKLLRALQEKEIERVGGKGTIKVDVRIIAATNRDLELEMEEGRFRSDLFYRLNIFPICLDSLRERREDIPMLATHFIHRYSKKVGKKITTLSNKILQELMQYNWPGNIRELEHLIERSVLLTTGDTLKQIQLPTNKAINSITANVEEVQLRTIDENERIHILGILKHCRGRISGGGGAAEILGVPASTLNSKIKRLGIRKEHLG